MFFFSDTKSTPTDLHSSATLNSCFNELASRSTGKPVLRTSHYGHD